MKSPVFCRGEAGGLHNRRDPEPVRTNVFWDSCKYNAAKGTWFGLGREGGKIARSEFTHGSLLADAQRSGMTGGAVSKVHGEASLNIKLNTGLTAPARWQPGPCSKKVYCQDAANALQIADIERNSAIVSRGVASTRCETSRRTSK
jgi:hypothetical protein